MKIFILWKKTKWTFWSTQYLFLYLFILELWEGRERGRGGEKHQCEREMCIDCLLYVPLSRIKSATQACALTRN